MQDRLSWIDSSLDCAVFEHTDVLCNDWFGVTRSEGIMSLIGVDFVQSFFPAAFFKRSRHLRNSQPHRLPGHVADIAINYGDGFQNVSVARQGEMNAWIQFPADQSNEVGVPPQKCNKCAFN